MRPLRVVCTLGSDLASACRFRWPTPPKRCQQRSSQPRYVIRVMPVTKHSAPREMANDLDDAVWILKCQNATYRVRLVPDMAAHRLVAQS